MTDDEKKQFIREVVDETLKRIYSKGTIEIEKDFYLRGEKELKAFYRDNKKDYSNIIERLKNERYYDILPLYFKERRTIEDIAEMIGVDESTIKRNKKKLCIKFYKYIKGDNNNVLQ